MSDTGKGLVVPGGLSTEDRDILLTLSAWSYARALGHVRLSYPACVRALARGQLRHFTHAPTREAAKRLRRVSPRDLRASVGVLLVRGVP